MSKLEDIYQFNKQLLEQLNVTYQEWQHEPILDFETDERVALQLGWTGTHSKSLFLKLKGSGYALLLTDKDSRLDTKRVKALTGKRASIVSNDEMIEQIGCVPGAVCPFGLPTEVLVIVDVELYQHSEILYTPGKPEFTFGIPANQLRNILSQLDNRVLEM